MASAIVGVHRNTADRYFRRIRHHIASLPPPAPLMGQVEIDESYFGGMRKGRRGRACQKIPVLGMVARGGNVHAQVIPNASSDTIIPIIQKNVVAESVIFTDKWWGYIPLSQAGYTHLTINHSRDFVVGNVHINTIENFWRQAKRNLYLHNGIPKHTFPDYLAECVWRFNNPDPRLQLATLEYLMGV